jgi:hypothetical protein
MQFPKPPKTEKKAPHGIKRTAIVRKADWKPLRRSSGATAKPLQRTPIARSSKPLRANKPLPRATKSLRATKPLPRATKPLNRSTKPIKCSTPIKRCPIKKPVDFAAAEAKRLARKAKQKTDRAVESEGKWPIVGGVMYIPDPLNPRGQREVCVTDAAWARAQATIRHRSKDTCEECHGLAPNGDAHHISGRTAGKRDDHPDALLNLCRRCHNKAKILRRVAAQQLKQQPQLEMDYGKDNQRSDFPLERDDGDATPSGGPHLPALLYAA